MFDTYFYDHKIKFFKNYSNFSSIQYLLKFIFLCLFTYYRRYVNATDN